MKSIRTLSLPVESAQFEEIGSPLVTRVFPMIVGSDPKMTSRTPGNENSDVLPSASVAVATDLNA